jgi:hypothetical protein
VAIREAKGLIINYDTPITMATGSQQSSSKGTSLRETYSERFQRLKERRELLHRKHIKKKGKREKSGKAKSSDGEERKEVNQEIHISTPSTGNSDSQLTLTELQSHIASDPYKQPFCISGSDKALLSIDEAIEDGNYDRAAQLSDKLSDQRVVMLNPTVKVSC